MCFWKSVEMGRHSLLEEEKVSKSGRQSGWINEHGGNTKLNCGYFNARNLVGKVD